MKKYFVLVLVLALLLTLVPMTASAATYNVTYDSSKTDEQNGTALFDVMNAAQDGDVINIGPGTYKFNDNTSRGLVHGKSVTVIGDGNSTVLESSKYGLVIDGLTNNPTVTIKDMKIVSTHSWAHSIYAKNSITLNLENLTLETAGGSAILLDSSNLIGGVSYNGINTVVNANNVTIDDGDIIDLNACPCSSTSMDHATETNFNFSNCTNIEEEDCKPQSVSKGYDNHFVNGVCINPSPIPPTVPADVPETGDNSPVFLLAALVAISGLSFALLKKRAC